MFDCRPRPRRTGSQHAEGLDLPGQCAVFVGHYAAGQDLTALDRNGWDIGAIDRRYKKFVDAQEPEADRLVQPPSSTADRPSPRISP
ncbi:hypothetical protein ABZY45_31890 [Streptomyces sp. NPDC006516]|uniref:hypothetical protein n=1 Tax=Streptomyces sp. NPDC006516 TaxID=3154309 RepID=UPI0033A4D5C4